MEKIKEQVAELIVFKATSFDELADEYNSVRNRVSEGLNNMRNVGVFSDAEIEEIKEYALTLIDSGYKATRGQISCDIRENFVF